MKSMAEHSAGTHHEHTRRYPCRICSSQVDPDHRATVGGVCHHCVYKALIIVLVVMVAISYVAWFGVL